ncbi:MAG: GNAT family N-acetyltransferase [Gammaproteobacteria bacterium]
MEHLRDIIGSDLPAILALNAAEVEKTSHMEHADLVALLRMSAYGKVVTAGTEVVAFLIALSDGVPYESDNFRWFAARMPHFLYVDRVVVDARFAGRGLGSRLYADLFHFARAGGTTTITCEYNIDPPNPVSCAFHDKFGFREVGTRWVAGGTKQVSLQAADTRAAAGGPARSRNPGGIP